jgi:very-short-patch-repair endonuclease
LSVVETDKLGKLARLQGGVFARSQVLRLGYTYDQIARRLETQQWRRVIGSVLAGATTQLDARSLEWAAYLACGPAAVLSGPSAIRRHGLDALPTADTLHWVTVPPERHMSFRGVRTIRESLAADDVVLVGGMRVTTVSRSVVDTLRVEPHFVGQPVLDRALLRAWLTVDDLATSVHQFAGRRGVGRLRMHLGRVRTGARSEAERRLHHLLEDAKLVGWSADFKVYDSGGALMAVLDVAFAARKVAVEVDGLAFHSDPERFQRDRTRQNWLVNQGWIVLRFTWDDLTERPAIVIATIRRTLSRQDPT